MSTRIITILLSAGLFCAAVSARGVESDASLPQSVTLSVYDTGMALVHELRRVTLAGGENVVRFSGLPSRVEPSTLSVTAARGPQGFQVLEQQFAYDLASPQHMLQRFVGQPVKVQGGQGTSEGVLLGSPRGDEESLVLERKDGASILFPNVGALYGVTFPFAARQAFLEPTLIWRAESKDDGPQNLRLNYVTEGLSWSASYELILTEEGELGQLSGRVAIANESGGVFERARIRLVSTEKGAGAVLEKKDVRTGLQRALSALRYPYGGENVTFERWVTGLTPVSTYELPRPLTLPAGESKHVELYKAGTLPVQRFFVYDGVRFDRFQRSRRNDWNYGTESHDVIEAHLEFVNSERFGLGFDLPPGVFRLYQRRRDGSVDLLGEDVLLATPKAGKAHVRLGPARGLGGERERMGYSEVVPLHEYEETFEIRLENDSDQEAEVRVVEHLYRWHEFEIVKADTEYELTGKQTIEFRPVLKPGGRRSIHYTVRYSW